MSAYREKALGEFSAKSVALHLNVLHDVFRSAVADELVQLNPVTGLERPRVQRKRWRILEPHERRLLGVQDRGTNEPETALVREEA